MFRTFQTVLSGVVDDGLIDNRKGSWIKTATMGEYWETRGDESDHDNWGFIGDMNELQENLKDVFWRRNLYFKGIRLV